MKPLQILLIACMLGSIALQAQTSNPFQSIHKKTATVTLTDGKYKESYDDDVLQRIGSVVIDTRTKKVVKMMDADSISNSASDNTAASRWISIDPHAQKYPSLSPYNYCSNNPINAVDLEGKDILVLNNPNGASGYGHMAALVGSDKNGWTFISKEGREKSPWYSNELTGGPALTPKIMTFTSLDAFKEAQKNDDDLGNYTQSVRLSTDDKQDASATDAMNESAHSWYNVVLSNCADAVSDGLKAAGLDPGNVTDNGGLYPVTTQPAKPNDRFNAIKKNNEGKIVPDANSSGTQNGNTNNQQNGNTQGGNAPAPNNPPAPNNQNQN